MSSRKLNNIFGQERSERNTTMFHLIAEEGLDNILDRIWNATRKKELEQILKLKNDDGETCLHTAVKKLKGSEAERIMAQLFDMGANLDAQEDGTGDTVLHLAVKRQDYVLMDWLLSMRIDKNIRNNSGLTAYQVAKQNNDYKMMKMILSENENVAECLVNELKSISLL
ncbi:putative ankyrin repeat protein RF_0381 [Cydia pomonella]|uniref:putative ankyrin repeat protein RF_0381 n=1 Tax=Cydia pomonella TaxID=82600 RepID=UPI002ADDF243|nr:putative ankyrin repeat protein RF_0381 [Cydia pomonella]XP_061729070.1 putative ankyrin repeat protein RF_0381 [Cydia pomonella]